MTYPIRTILSLSLCLVFMPASLSLAEDIDIYASAAGGSNPNVLIVLDNSANWSANNQNWPNSDTCTAQCKQGKAELNAIRTVIGELGANFNIGLMMLTSGSTDGAYPRFHVRPMNSDNKTSFMDLIGAPGCTASTNTLTGTSNCIYERFDDPESNGGEKTNSASTRYSAAMFSAFKYFGGYTSPALAATNTAGTPTGTASFGPLRYTEGTYLGDPAAYTDAARTTYNSPINDTNSCAKNYVIFIGNGFPSQDSPAGLLSGVGGVTTQFDLPTINYTTSQQTTYLATTAIGTYANAAACQTAAATTYGTAYSSYTCVPEASSSNTNYTNLVDTAYGVYATEAACTAGETAANSNTYDQVLCTQSGSSIGNTNMGDTACGTYADVSSCSSAETAAHPEYPSGVVCTQLAGTCSYTVASGTQTSSCYANVSSCQTNAATDFLGSPAWSTRVCGSVVSSGCAYSVSSSVSYCADDLADCQALATADGFNAGFSANYTSNNCSPNRAGFKVCNVSGTKSFNNGNRYTITGVLNSNSGLSFSRSGLGATTYKYQRVGSKTTTQYSYKIYGNYTISEPVAVPNQTTAPSNQEVNYADEWAAYMYQTDVSPVAGKQNVRTYTVDVFKDQPDVNQHRLLMSMANNSGGKYYSASNEDALRKALRSIFSEIQAVNSVFASSSLPVSVNTQGTYLNQVFIGMFRPDSAGLPRWAGNLKQYQFKLDGPTLRLVDKNLDPAINPSTGFITPCANSFWTTDSGSTYWDYGDNPEMSKGSCTAEFSAFPTANSPSAYSDAPDGDVVEKGGAAQQLRGVESPNGTLVASTQRYDVCTGLDTPSTANCRKLLTCNNNTCSTSPSLLEFSTANAGVGSNNPSLSAATLGVLDDTARDTLISWVRGKDTEDENENGVTAEVRPSVHGAVVHSQPAVIDYGSNVGVYAFYGADDGVFHAVDGGKTDLEGTEVWGFIAPESYGVLKRARNNAPKVNIPGVLDADATSKSYFFDGSVGVFQRSGTVWIYPTMRRGGRAVYAFDVSTPTSPTLKWRRGCFTNATSDDSNCTAGWSDIGQTWSKPQLAYIEGYVDINGTSKPVLIFGGGYDTCEDVDSQTRCASSPRKGANVWFVDADTGDVLRKYATNYSVPGDVFVGRDGNNNVRYVYATDSGGYVYRINVGRKPDSWADDSEMVSKGWVSNSLVSNIVIANLSEANHKRKFLFGPDVVEYGSYHAVMVGSGDREHPLLTNYPCNSSSTTAGQFVQNQFYMIKDTPGNYPASPTLAADLTDVTNDTLGVTTIGNYGWRFNLGRCEQTVNKALTIGGKVFFGTNQPVTNTAYTCGTGLGVARGYSVEIDTAAAPCANCSRFTTYAGGGLPPSPVAGVVEVEGYRVPFLLGGSIATADNECVGEACSALGGTKIEINPAGARYRMFWYIEKD